MPGGWSLSTSWLSMPLFGSWNPTAMRSFTASVRCFPVRAGMVNVALLTRSVTVPFFCSFSPPVGFCERTTSGGSLPSTSLRLTLKPASLSAWSASVNDLLTTLGTSAVGPLPPPPPAPASRAMITAAISTTPRIPATSAPRRFRLCSSGSCPSGAATGAA